MFYEHGGNIYASREVKGVKLWKRMRVQIVAGETRIVETGDSIKKLPPGARPLTALEVLARYPAEGGE